MQVESLRQSHLDVLLLSTVVADADTLLASCAQVSRSTLQQLQ